MREHASLLRDTFDIRWVDTGLRVSVSMSSPRGATVVPTPIASFTIGIICVVNQETFKNFAPVVDVRNVPCVRAWGVGGVISTKTVRGRFTWRLSAGVSIGTCIAQL